MPATVVNLNGINELDLNLNGTTSATTANGVTTVNNTPAIATSTTVGVVKPDNRSIQVLSDGTISSSGSAPSFVQGAEATSGTTNVPISLSGIVSGDTLVLHLRTGLSTAPALASSMGNAYVAIGTVGSSFWGVYTYTYICLASGAGAETATFSGVTGGGTVLLAEYTQAGGYEVFAANGISANAGTISSQAITSTKNFERAVFIFSVSAFSGQTPNQTQRVPTSGSANMVLMDALAQTIGTYTGTVTSAAMNQATITAFFLSPLGSVQSVGLLMPPDFAVTGSPVIGTGVIQVTGGVTKSGVQQNLYSTASDTGSVNAYAVTLSPAPTLVVGSDIIFKAGSTNTGPATITVNGLTYPLKKNGTTALASGDITINQMIIGTFDGTNFQIPVPGSGGGGGGVTSLNTLAGALSIVAGANVTVTPAGSNITIASTGGGGGTSAVLSGKTVYTSATRVLGTIYQNTSAFPIVVFYNDNATTAPIGFSDTVTPPVKVVASCQTYTSTAAQPVLFLVMPGNYYKVTGVTWGTWIEYQFNTGTFTSSGDLNAGTRVLGTTYQNTGSGAMWVQIMTTNTTATNSLSVVCDASSTPTTTAFSQQTVAASGNSILFLVPQNYYYKVACTGVPTIAHWFEYSSNIAAVASVNLITAPARRAITANASVAPLVYSVFNNSGKTRWMQVGFTNGSTGTASSATDEVCPPITVVYNTAGIGGAQIRGLAGFHQPNEFWFTKMDGGTCAASFWLEYTLG